MLDSLDTLVSFVLIMLVVSLLITIAVQMVSALFNLRGLNLLSGLGSTFAVIDPTMEKERKALARFVLKGRFLSDSFMPNLPILRMWRHTEAIRSKEIFDAIFRIAIGKEPIGKRPVMENLWNWLQRCVFGKGAPDFKENARRLLIALGVDKQTLDDAAKKITDAGSTDELRAAAIAAADKIIAAGGSIDAAYQRFEGWTGTCQERAQQWLTMHTRILTILFALVAAFWLQLDTVEIFKLVSSNKAVRDKLVAQAGAVEAQASRILGADNNVLKDAIRDWSQKQTDPAIKTALAGIEIKDFDTRESVRNTVTAVLKGKTPIDNFDKMVNDTAMNRIKAQAEDFKTVKADFEKSGFDLFPKDNAYRWGKSWSDHFDEHWIGMLFSVGLLSLGAPFWYNTLKNLVSLRSAVAQNISKEQEIAQKEADAKKAKAPPTTVQPVK